MTDFLTSSDSIYKYSTAARVTRVVLVADVVESVRLAEQNEDGFFAHWLPFIDRVKAEVLPANSGRFVKSTGDGLLVEFNDPKSAVAAAFAIQEASSEANYAKSPDSQVSLRIGIELGDVINRDNDVYGRGVNRAARLVTLAGPGEIVVSASVRDHLTADLDADVEDLGDCYLRHVPNPVRAFRIGPPGGHALPPSGAAGELLPTVAVIPFTTRDVGDEHNVLGEVIAEELIADLARSPELSVISRLSTTAFRGRAATLSEIGARLSSSYVLSGEYRLRGSRITIDVELADVLSEQIISSRRHHGQVSALLSGRRELIDHIAADVNSAVLLREQQQARSMALPTLKSYTLLLAAISLMHRGSGHDFEDARQLLDALIDRAGRHAIPHAWLAKWYVLRVQQGWSGDAQQDTRMALQCTRQALDADPDCSLALAMDGLVHTHFTKRLDLAHDRYDAAIIANPNDPLAWLLKGTLHAFRGEGDLAVKCTQRASRLSPLDPHKYYYDSLSATASIAAGKYDNAMKLATRSLRANRNHTSTLRVLAVAQWQLGFQEQARETAQELLRREPHLTVSRWLERSPSAPFEVGQEVARVLRQVGVPD